jgi:hypothetical protein
MSALGRPIVLALLTMSRDGVRSSHGYFQACSPRGSAKTSFADSLNLLAIGQINVLRRHLKSLDAAHRRMVDRTRGARDDSCSGGHHAAAGQRAGHRTIVAASLGHPHRGRPWVLNGRPWVWRLARVRGCRESMRPSRWRLLTCLTAWLTSRPRSPLHHGHTTTLR